MAKRILAVVLAIGLIAGAIALRAALDGDDGANGSDGPTTTRQGRRLEVWCLEDLRAPCEEALAGDVSLTIGSMEDAMVRLAAADVDDDLPDAWVTFAPLPEMAKDAVARAGGPADSIATSTAFVATTHLIVATRPDRAALLGAACVEPALWRCLGEIAGTKWLDLGGPESFQAIKPAFGDPTRSATALMAWASAVGHYLGREAFSINDVNADDAFTAWGRNLRAADPLGGQGDPLAELVLSRVQRDVAGGTEAAFSQLNGLTRVGEPYGRVDALLCGFAGTTVPEAFQQRLLAALVAAGWSPADPTTAPASRPGFTTFVALQNTWKELG